MRRAPGTPEVESVYQSGYDRGFLAGQSGAAASVQRLQAEVQSLRDRLDAMTMRGMMTAGDSSGGD